MAFCEGRLASGHLATGLCLRGLKTDWRSGIAGSFGLCSEA